MSAAPTIGYNPNLHRWYVLDGRRYLHRDGVWRDTASANCDGGGLFDSEDEARAMANNAA